MKNRNPIDGGYSLAVSKFDKSPPYTRDFSRELGGFSCKNVKHMV